MAINDSDLFLINRDNITYKLTGEKLIEFTSDIPGDLTVGGSITAAGRLTGKRLDITGGEGGSPASAIVVYDNDNNENFSIRADGVINAGQTSLTTSGRQPAESTLVLNNTNVDGYSIYSQSNGTGTFAISTDGTVSVGDVNGAPLITLQASNGSASFAGTLTSNGITQYLLPTMGNGGQLGWDSPTESLRLYANSSTNTNATVQFHFNQSNTADITFDQGGTITANGYSMASLAQL